jgi:hypothetical protein
MQIAASRHTEMAKQFAVL